MAIQHILSILVTAIGIWGTLITVISLFVEIEKGGKIPITPGKMTVLVIFILLFSIGLAASTQLDWSSIDKSVITNSEAPTNDTLSGNIGDEILMVPVPNEIITETKCKITCDTSNYLGNVELSSNFANDGETITVFVDAHQFHSIYITDADGNPIEISLPPVLGNTTIPFIFDMPASDVTIFIEGE